jgi:hypothetical protein
MATLIRQMGSKLVNREELSKIETPAATKTWIPIKHHDLLLEVEGALARKQITITKEQLSVQRDGMFFFSVLDLKYSNGYSDYTSALGLRSSNNKVVAIQIAVGARVIVCDNLMFKGDLIALKKKHSAGLALRQELDSAIETFVQKFASMSYEINAMKQKKLSDNDAKTLLFDMFVTKKVMPTRMINEVAQEYFEPSYEEFKGGTLWTLQNAFTTVAKQLPEERKWRALRELGTIFNGLTKE